MSEEGPAVIFEELDSELVPEYELSEFVEAPLTMASYEDASTSYATSQTSNKATDPPDTKPQQKGNLIKRFIKGDLDYFDFNIQSDQEEEEEEEEEGEEEDQEEYEEDPESDDSLMKASRRRWKSKSHKSRTTKRHVLPIALQGLMGQANLCFARNEVDMAEKLCLEIIRQAHMAPEPYLTLAQIYEGRDKDKFIQFSLIAAYLQPNDEDQWIRLADLLIEQGNPKKAVTCFTRALKVNRHNVDIHLKRIEVLKSVGEEALAFRCCFRMIQFVPPERGDLLMATAKMVAQKFHEDNNLVSALEAMSTAYERGADLFKTEDINLFLELLLANSKHSRALEVITKHCGVGVQWGSGDPPEVVAIDIPDSLILDFRAKLAVVLVHMKAFHLIDVLSENVFSTINVEEAGDCYLDIAEALMKEKKYEQALMFLEPLVTSTNFR
jgi:general transcription factor 3C polypeptide 3 (transcription factor C subunit 4)